MKLLLIIYIIISLLLLIEYKYNKDSSSLEKDGFISLKNIDNKSVLNYLPKGYVYLDYKYTIKGCSLSTFHRDVTSDQYTFKTKHPTYTMARYFNKGPHLSVCPGSHLTTPYLYSNPYTIYGNEKDCYLFNCDLVHAGSLNTFGKKRHMEQFKIAHLDDIKPNMNIRGKCVNNCLPNSLHKINKIQENNNCDLNYIYNILLRKLSLFFSFFINHIFTNSLQKKNKFIGHFIQKIGYDYYNK